MPETRYITRVRYPEEAEPDKYFTRFSAAVSWARHKWPDSEGAKITIDADLGTAMVFDRHDRVLCTMRQVELN